MSGYRPRLSGALRFPGSRRGADSQYRHSADWPHHPGGRGDRTTLATGESIILKADTALTGSESGRTPELSDNGVPFTYLDNGVRSNIRYFYSVTAFDVNSIQSGPSNIESPRNTKSITPQAEASNFQNQATLTNNIVGRGIAQDSLITSEPSLDPATGKFSGPFPPANGGELQFAGQFARQVIAAGCGFGAAWTASRWGPPTTLLPLPITSLRTGGDGTTFPLTIGVTQDQTDVDGTGNAVFNAVPVDAALAERFGGIGAFILNAEVVQTLPGNYYTNSFGRGCINEADGFALDPGCDYNGARWFDGPSPAQNETVDNPTAGNQKNSAWPAVFTNPNNAGGLTGVAAIHEDRSYQTIDNVWRNIEGVLGRAKRAADFNVYWGAGGVVDSVIDVTHNVPVAFGADARRNLGLPQRSRCGSRRVQRTDRRP